MIDLATFPSKKPKLKLYKFKYIAKARFLLYLADFLYISISFASARRWIRTTATLRLRRVIKYKKYNYRLQFPYSLCNVYKVVGDTLRIRGERQVLRAYVGSTRAYV